MTTKGVVKFKCVCVCVCVLLWESKAEDDNGSVNEVECVCLPETVTSDWEGGSFEI